MKDKITVIVPIYNVEDYLRQCLDSIVNQTYRNIEIILVDDGSPDQCGEICDEYAAKDERVKAIHKENGGVNSARNLGIEKATGDWIAFVDSDDWIDENFYENMIKYAKQEIDVLYAGGYYVEYHEKNLKAITFAEQISFSDNESIAKLRQMILMPGRDRNVAFGYPFDKLYNASFLKKYHLRFDINLKAWDDMWTNFIFFSYAKNISTCPVIGYHYRQVMTSITKGYNPMKATIMYQVLTTFHEYEQENMLSPELSEAIVEIAIPAINTALQCGCFHPLNQKSKIEVKTEIKKIKSLPFFKMAIWNKKNIFLSTPQKVLKYALRVPCTWPLKVLYKANTARKILWG